MGDRCGILEYLHSFREAKFLQGYFKTLWMSTKNIKTLLGGSSAYYSGGYEFDSLEKPTFYSRITKFVLRSSGDLSFVILVEDSDTGGPSTITVRTSEDFRQYLSEEHPPFTVWYRSILSVSVPWLG